MRSNIIVVLDPRAENVLLCLRTHEPYAGLYNFVGGKVEGDESEIESAYRELAEETGITQEDIELVHFMNQYYAFSDTELVTFVGRLKHDVNLIPEKNPLEWVPVNQEFFDMKRFAAEGNVGHIMENVKYYIARGVI